MWILYSFLGAFADTIRDTVQKRNTVHYSPVVSGFALNFFGALITLPFIVFLGIPHLKEGYWHATAVLALCSSFWPILFSYALKHDKLSNMAPLLALNPITTTLVTLLYYHKGPSILGWVGILLVFLGLYLTRFEPILFRTRGVLFPFIHLFSSLGSIAMIGVAMIWSIGAIAGNIVVQTSSSLFYIPTSVISATVISFFVVLIFEKSFYRRILQVTPAMIPFSLIHLLSEFSVGMALATGFIPYVASIKRSAIIGSTVAGIFIFKEKVNAFKIMGVIVTFLGVVTIVIGR